MFAPVLLAHFFKGATGAPLLLSLETCSPSGVSYESFRRVNIDTALSGWTHVVCFVVVVVVVVCNSRLK